MRRMFSQSHLVRLMGRPLVIGQTRPLARGKTFSLQPARSCTSRYDVYSEEASEDFDPEDQQEMQQLVERYLHTAASPHQVLVIQPFIRTGPQQQVTATRQLMLDESVALAETLDWKVVDTVSLGLSSFKKKYLFGSGNLEMLREKVAANQSITAVFVSLYQLTAVQRLQFESLFQVPVIDRYHLVLQIFFQHAQTRESKLQVALAEIPYLKNRLSVQYQIERESKGSGGNLGEQYFEKQRFVLKKMENGVKKKISDLKQQRDKLREGRRKNEVPTVAVIGYTNCGKTSLIRALTSSSLLEPKDKLFATLDVTCHRTTLPDINLEVVFIDTVGFISDIPTPLIASFSSTLEDALQADLLLHVRDVSHPDTTNQQEQVLATLRRLGVPPRSLGAMLTVGNKIDKVPQERWLGVKEAGALPLSCTLGLGLDHLVSSLTPKLLEARSLRTFAIRLRPGGEEEAWLRRHGSVSTTEVCPKDQNFHLVTVLLSEAGEQKFRSRFVKETVSAG